MVGPARNKGSRRVDYAIDQLKGLDYREMNF
jgi:hypothetical protein